MGILKRCLLILLCALLSTQGTAFARHMERHGTDSHALSGPMAHGHASHHTGHDLDAGEAGVSMGKCFASAQVFGGVSTHTVFTLTLTQRAPVSTVPHALWRPLRPPEKPPRLTA